MDIGPIQGFFFSKVQNFPAEADSLENPVCVKKLKMTQNP